MYYYSYSFTSDIADTLRYLLLGSGEITLENLEVVMYFIWLIFTTFLIFWTPVGVSLPKWNLWDLVTHQVGRRSNFLSSIVIAVCLLCSELLPPLPKDGMYIQSFTDSAHHLGPSLFRDLSNRWDYVHQAAFNDPGMVLVCMCLCVHACACMHLWNCN